MSNGLAALSSSPTSRSRKSTASELKHSDSSASNASSGRSATPGQRDVTDRVGQSFPPFDHNVISARMDESDRNYDATLDQTYIALYHCLRSFHAWSITRPRMEREGAYETLNQDVNALLAWEQNQGESSPSTPPPSSTLSYLERIRQKLMIFITNLNDALAGLSSADDTHI